MLKKISLFLFLVMMATTTRAQGVDSVIVLNTETFSSWIPTGWTVLDLGGSAPANQWFSFTYYGDSVAAISYSGTASDDWLITPTLSELPGVCDSVVLYYWRRFSHWPAEAGSSFVLLSHDGGTTWTDTLVIYPTVAAVAAEEGDTSIRIDSHGPFTGNEKIAFWYHHANGDAWYVDDVKVVRYVSEPLPPEITHSDYYYPGVPFFVSEYPETAYITDLTGVDSAFICYDVNYSGDFSCVPMEYRGSNPNRVGLWVGYIPAQPSWSRIRYYIYAIDSYTPSPSADTTDTFVLAVQDNYYMFDDVDSDPERPDTTWFDIISRGAYKIDDGWTALTDDSAIALPFTFRFYGVDYDTVFVHMSGFLRFEPQLPYFDVNANQNYPDTISPNGIVGMWSKLVASATLGGDVWVLDSDDDTFAVLFDSMGWVNPAGSTEPGVITMEILLISPTICDEPGGNGEIIIRFKEVNNTSILSHATVGIEQQDGLLGSTYLFNGTYDTYAEGIVPGRGIKFSTTPPVYWGNAGVVRGYTDLRGTPTWGDSGIALELVDAHLVVHSGPGGFFEFLGVPPGRYFVRATYPGYDFDISPSFNISERETVWLDTLTITPIPITRRLVASFEATPQPGIAIGEWEWGGINPDSFNYSTIPPTCTPPTGAHTGTKMWGTLINGEYHNLAADTLILPTIPDTITFWHYYDFEVGRDGGQILFSEDFCQTWQVVHPLRGYDDSVAALGDSGFTGSSGTWRQDTIDLSETAATHIAFVFRSDSAGTKAGWYIDDVFVALPTRKTGVISGYVYDGTDYTPVAGAVVLGRGDSAITDDIGHFVLDSAEAGEYQLTVRAPGYIENHSNVLLGKSDSISVNIALYKINITPSSTIGYQWEFTYNSTDSNAIQICNPTDDTIIVAAKVKNSASSSETLAIVDSINIAAVPSISVVSAVGCRARGRILQYWITSHDPSYGNRYNFVFDADKNYTGTRFSTLPYTGLSDPAGDMTYDGRYFWQTVPGRPVIYAINPINGQVMDSIVAPAGTEWHYTAVMGLAYDPVNDVFFLGDTTGKIHKIAGKSWDLPGDEIAAWQVYLPVGGEPFRIYGLAYDFGRRSLWATGYRPSENILAEIRADGDTFQVLYQIAKFGKIIALDISADRKLWAVFDTAGTYKVYAIGNLAGQLLPYGLALTPDTLVLPPGGCDSLFLISSPKTYCGNSEITVQMSAGINGEFSPPTEYPMHIVVSPALSAGWNLIAVPVAASPNDVVVQLEDDISPFYNEPSNSNIFGWDPERGMYVVPDSFARGDGYFLKSWSNNKHFDISGTPYYSNFYRTLPYYETSLYPGWFLVGNPVNYPLDWDAIVSDPEFSGIAPTYYTLTPEGWASYTPGFPAGATRYINPYSGFFVSVLPGHIGTLPFRENSFLPAMARTLAANSTDNTIIRLMVITPEATDGWNFFGTSPYANDSIDDYDALNPPSPGKIEFAGFVNGGKNLSRDIREPLNEETSFKQWTLHIDNLAPGEPVSIRWNLEHTPDETDCSIGTAQLPDGISLTLTNPITGETVDMRVISEYNFRYSEPTDLIITMSLNSLGAENSKTPEAPALTAIPNPFNANTEIKFFLPERAEISIIIVATDGKVVRKLASGNWASGWHTIKWNGKDQNGNETPSGVYMCRMNINGEECRTTKLILLR